MTRFGVLGVPEETGPHDRIVRLLDAFARAGAFRELPPVEVTGTCINLAARYGAITVEQVVARLAQPCAESVVLAVFDALACGGAGGLFLDVYHMNRRWGGEPKFVERVPFGSTTSMLAHCERGCPHCGDSDCDALRFNVGFTLKLG